MHVFDHDLYGQLLKVCICGYIRPEQNFDSLESLIERINQDIAIANESLDKPEFLEYKNSDFFKSNT